ncbi:MAG: thiamine-phosphate kinase, partial [Rhodospirillales bacterium]|nr:thiamine-phosphate kinase [Rhodospirillales bacterium]
MIARYFAPLAAGHPGAFALTDDAASFTAPPGHDLVLTCDAVAEGVHYLPGDAPA